MTDPIRIPNVAVFEDGHGTKYRQITSYAEVAPELARQIVALSGIKDGFWPINDAITQMVARVEALEVGLAQLGITVVPVMVDGKPLVVPKPAPVDAGPAKGPVSPPPGSGSVPDAR